MDCEGLLISRTIIVLFIWSLRLLSGLYWLGCLGWLLRCCQMTWYVHNDIVDIGVSVFYCSSSHKHGVISVNISAQEEEVNEPPETKQSTSEKIYDASYDFANIKAVNTGPTEEEP